MDKEVLVYEARDGKLSNTMALNVNRPLRDVVCVGSSVIMCTDRKELIVYTAR